MSSDRLRLLREFLAALALAREEAMVEQDEPWQALTWFTDNVVVAFPIMRGHIDEEPALGSALRAATYLQLRLAMNGFFVRGGITFGDIHMAQHVAFGPALIEAVHLEHVAREPRVILSPAALALQRKVMHSWAKDAAHSGWKWRSIRTGSSSSTISDSGWTKNMIATSSIMSSSVIATLSRTSSPDMPRRQTFIESSNGYPRTTIGSSNAD